MVTGSFADTDERRPPFAWAPVQVFLLMLLPALGLAAPARAQVQESCYPAATHLCLSGDRFQVDVDWMLPSGPGKGQAVPLTADTGLFWFFGNSNLELIVKVLDGRPVNGHFWVYYGGLSDVEYKITVTDTKTGVREIYTNPAGRLASGSDTSAFNVEAAAAPGPARPGGAGEPAPLLRQGEEMRANVTTRGVQSDPSVAVGPGGVSMVTWSGPPPPGLDNQGNVYGRFYDRAGNPRGGELRLNSEDSGAQFGARVAASPTGEFMAVWNDADRVVARLYGAGGQPLGGEIRVGATAGLQGQPAITGDPAGGFLVGWPDAAGAGTLRLQRFNAQGNVVGNEISLLRSGSGLGLAASPAPGGGFLISWIESAGFLETNVRALRLDASAQPLSGTALWANIDAVRHPGYQLGAAVPVFHADGGFSVLWTSLSFNGQSEANGLFARRYTAGGEPAGGVIALRRQGSVGEWAPAAAVLPSGATLVLWYEGNRNDDVDGGTFGRLYDPSWQPIGGEFRANTFTQAQQGAPAVAADSSGTLFTAWQSGRDPSPFIPIPGEETEGQDGSYFGIYAQRFTTASCAADSARQLCLNGRFRVEVRFVDPRSNLPGAGRAVPLTSDTGGFWFFDASNTELMIKILDGRALNGHFWVFAGALSDVEYTITVTDTQTGKSKAYRNEPHQLTSRSDTTAF